MENGITNSDINVQNLDYAFIFFNELIGYDQFKFDTEYVEVIPTMKDINFLKNWLDEHYDELSWNEEKHKLELE